MQQPVTRNPAYPAVAFPPPPVRGRSDGADGPYHTSSRRYHGAPPPPPPSGGGASSGLDGKLTSPASRSPLRGRDAAAILTCLLLLRLAFSPSGGSGGGLVDPGAGSVAASVELAFYAPFQSTPPGDGDGGPRGDAKRRTASPVPLALDGAVDALAVPVYLTRDEVRLEREAEMSAGRRQKRGGSTAPEVPASDLEGWADGGSWGIRILSLRPPRGAADDGGSEGPYAPRSAFLSPLVPRSTHPAEEEEEGSEERTPGRPVPPEAYPVRLLPVQIPIERTRLGEEERSRQRHSSSQHPGSYGKSGSIPPKADGREDYDRTRHYFCGTDWHHASGSCHRHCPGGQASECAEGETCYADTPCDARLAPSSRSDGGDGTGPRLALTRAGTLPGVAAVWSDGAVSLHVVTADVHPPTLGPDGHRAKRARKKRPELELRQLWRAFPFEPEAHDEEKHGDGEEEHGHEVEFDELGLTFESSAVFAGDEGGGDGVGDHGAILIGGRYTLTADGHAHPLKVSYHALDSMTGESLWDIKHWRHARKDGAKTAPDKGPKKDKDDGPAVPLLHLTSSARRRSHLPTPDDADPELDNENFFVEGDDAMTSEECTARFRSSVLDPAGGAMPHEFAGLGSMGVGRFDRGGRGGGGGRRGKGKAGRRARPGGGASAAVDGTAGADGGGGDARPSRAASDGEKGWQAELFRRAAPDRLLKKRERDARHPHRGRPNVVLFHGREGLAVLSLRNGRPVCHLSLTDKTLYADLDSDGVIDQVSVVTTPNGDWEPKSQVQKLIARLTEESAAARPDGGDAGRGGRGRPASSNAPEICHALVTSGLPPREEIFTAPLCPGGPSIHSHYLSAAPPLLVEGSLGRGHDVVFALNTGVVVRYDVNGREVWRKRGGLGDGTPSWTGRADAAPPLLGRVEFGAARGHREAHASVSATARRDRHRPGSPARPLLLSGENGAAVLSSAGRVLSSVTYPQRGVRARPTLVDLNGDGTDDLLVVTEDAVWGYSIVVETGRSGGFTLAVVSLLMCVAVSALVHKAGQAPGQSRRSTDP